MKRGSKKSNGTPAKRGRPPKFGRPASVVAITLPEETIRGLKRVDADLAWAIVHLVERQASRVSTPGGTNGHSELVGVANGKSLIVVNRTAFKALPGVSVIPLHGDRGFLALDREGGIADLEVAVLDRLAMRSVGDRERAALIELRARLRRLRRDQSLRCRTRSIIVVERVR